MLFMSFFWTHKVCTEFISSTFAGPTSSITQKHVSMQMHLDTVSDEDGLESDADGCWPFQSFVEQLMVDMFDPCKQLFNAITCRIFMIFFL